LVGNYSFAHHTLDDTQDARIDKELGREAGSLKGHGQEVAMWSAVWFFSMSFQVVEKDWPERFPAGFD
jgi:hypothetical protein